MATRRPYAPEHGTLLEHAIVRALLSEAAKNGWHPIKTDSRCTQSERSVLKEVFEQGGSHVTFRKGKERGAPTRWVYLIPGNGEDIISDFSIGAKMDDRYAEDSSETTDGCKPGTLGAAIERVYAALQSRDNLGRLRGYLELVIL